MLQYPFSDNPLLRVEVFWIFLIGIWLLFSLFAVWIATRDWHWFLRLGLLAAAVSVLKLIEAEDLMLMQLSNCMTIFSLLVGWKTYRQWKTKPDRWRDWRKRLSLAELLLVVAALAILLSIIFVDLTDLVPRSFCIGFGCAVGLAFMVGAGLMTIANRWVNIAAVLAAMIWAYFASHWISSELINNAIFSRMLWDSFLAGNTNSFARSILVVMAVSGLIVGGLNRTNRQADGFAKILTRIGTALFVFVVNLFAVMTLDVGFRLTYRFPQRSAEQISPNQFEKMLPIAERFNASTVFNSELPAEAIFRNEILAYRDDLDRLEALLDDVDPDVSLQAGFGDDGSWERLKPAVIGFRGIARALAHKARLDFAAENPDQALSDSVVIIRLRDPLSREGFITTELTGMAIEGIGQYSITESIPHASKQAIGKALQDVLELEAKPYAPRLSYENDKVVTWQSNNWYGRLDTLCDCGALETHFEHGIMPLVRRIIATRQQVIAMLALELHRRDREVYPQRLEALVPEYLDLVPSDPFGDDGGDAPLRYEAIDGGKDYLLYSVGLNQQDDGGELSDAGYATPAEDAGDLNLKEATRLDRVERDAEIAERDLKVEEE